MPTKLTAIDYTDAELLALCKAAIAELTVFQTTTFRGRGRILRQPVEKCGIQSGRG